MKGRRGISPQKKKGRKPLIGAFHIRGLSLYPSLIFFPFFTNASSLYFLSSDFLRQALLISSLSLCISRPPNLSFLPSFSLFLSFQWLPNCDLTKRQLVDWHVLEQLGQRTPKQLGLAQPNMKRCRWRRWPLSLPVLGANLIISTPSSR